MNVKLRVEEVRPLIKAPIDQMAKVVAPLAERARLVMPTPQVGVGYMQWNLPGSGWRPFSSADPETKSLIAEEFKKRRQTLLESLPGNDTVKSAIARVPSEDFIYFRENEEGMDICLVAWGYRFLETPTVTDLDTYITRVHMQNVRIGFLWDGNVLPSFSFRLAGFPRETGEDGYFYVDNPLLVGKQFKVATLSGREWDLRVEEGKEEYLYDLTRTATVVASVTKDGAPLGNVVCSMHFGDLSRELVCDASGHAETVIALPVGPDGELLPEQPECVVAFEDQTESQVPYDGAVLRYTLSLKTPEPEPEPEPEVKPVPVVEDVPAAQVEYQKIPMFALGTNLLFDLAITPNFSFEVPVGQHWSILGEYTFPWWVTRDNSRAWQMIKLDQGVRYYFGHKNMNNPMDIFQGHFLGAQVGMGYYDVEPHHNGWQGEGIIGGLEYGYAWRLGECWRMEAFAAVGAVFFDYRYYMANENDSKLMYKYNGSYSVWPLPTKAGVAIKYIFNRKEQR